MSPPLLRRPMRWIVVLSCLLGLLVGVESSQETGATRATSEEQHRSLQTSTESIAAINAVLGDIELNVDLPDISGEINGVVVGPFNVDLTYVVGDTAVCKNIGLSDSAAFEVTNDFQGRPGGFPNDQVYDLGLVLKGFTLECTFDVRVHAEQTVIDVQWTQVDRLGKLTATVTNGEVYQKFTMVSPDFDNTLAQSYDLQQCGTSIDDMTLEGQELLILSILGNIEAAEVDMTGEVLSYLRGDSSIISGPLTEELCKIYVEVTTLAADFLVDNEFVFPGGEFDIPNPFTAPSSAVQLENQVFEIIRNNTGQEYDLVNLRDQDNLLVSILISPELNGTTPNALYDLLTFLEDDTLEGEYDTFSYLYDPVLLLLDDVFDMGYRDSGGEFKGFDVFDALNITEPVDFGLDLEFDSVNIDLNFSLDDLSIGLRPLKYRNGNNPAFPNFLALGEETLYLPGIYLHNFSFQFNLTLYGRIENLGDSESEFLASPWTLDFSEPFVIDLTWTEFRTYLAALFPLDWNALMKLPLGPVANLDESTFDCVMSAFNTLTPRLSGLTFEHKEIFSTLSKFEGFIPKVLQSAWNSVIPVYQSVIPRAAEWIFHENFVNTELFAPATCPAVDQSLDNYNRHMYDFSEGLVRDVADLLTLETVSEVLDTLDLSSSGFDILGEPLIVNFTMPVYQGWQQGFEGVLQYVNVEGILPPQLNELRVLQMMEDSSLYPQELESFVDAGSSENPLKLVIGLSVKSTQPVNVDGNGNDYPLEMFPQENQMVLELSTSHIDALIDLYVSYSQFDVDAFELGELTNLQCYISKLNRENFVTSLKVTLHQLATSMECDCQNRLLTEISSIMNSDERTEDLREFLNDIVDRLENLVMDLFKGEQWPRTRLDAINSCDNVNLNDGNASQSGEYYESHGDVGALLSYLGFFAAAVLIPMLIFKFLSYHGPALEKHHEDDLDKLESPNLKFALVKNPDVPLCVRIAIPILVLVNAVILVVGDTSDAVRIDATAQILDIPLSFDNFATLSVLSTVQALWAGGAYFLAGALGFLSIFWPYFKLFLIVLMWVISPQKVSPKTRGKVIEVIDQLGRFSFAEFHFMVFVIVIFQIRGGSPKVSFLPSDDLFFLQLEIIPLPGLFAFCLAVVMSIVLGNIVLYYQRSVMTAHRYAVREERLAEAEKAKSVVGLSQFAIDEDNFRFRMTAWEFSVYEQRNNGEKEKESSQDERKEEDSYNYTYSLTTQTVIVAAGAVILSSVLLLVTTLTKSLHIEFSGLIGFLMEFAGDEKDYELSVFGLLIEITNAYEGNYIITFVAAIFILTIALVPIAQTVLLFGLLFQAFSVPTARRISEAHHIMSVWCCVDVFVIAIALTVLEIPAVADGLVASIEECEFVGDLMEDILLPLDLVSEEDAAAKCMQLHSSISIGAYIAVVAVLVLNLTNFVVAQLFHTYVKDREQVVAIAQIIELETGNDKMILSQTSYKPWHEKLSRLGFIKLETLAARVQRRVDEAKNAEDLKMVVAVKNPMIDPSVVSSEDGYDQVVTHMLPGKKQLAEARRKEEVKLKKKKALEAFNYTMPAQQRVNIQLEAFFGQHDPKLLHVVPALVNEAFSRPDGLARLNDKLLDKYGATISLDL